MASNPLNPPLSNRLLSMLNSSTSLDALSLVSMDGLEIASALPQEVNGARMAAMTLASFTVGEQIARELERGLLQEVVIKGDRGYIVITPIKSKALLIALSRSEARIGLMLLEMRRITSELLRPIRRKSAEKRK